MIINEISALTLIYVYIFSSLELLTIDSQGLLDLKFIHMYDYLLIGFVLLLLYIQSF